MLLRAVSQSCNWRNNMPWCRSLAQKVWTQMRRAVVSRNKVVPSNTELHTGRVEKPQLHWLLSFKSKTSSIGFKLKGNIETLGAYIYGWPWFYNDSFARRQAICSRHSVRLFKLLNSILSWEKFAGLGCCIGIHAKSERTTGKSCSTSDLIKQENRRVKHSQTSEVSKIST